MKINKFNIRTIRETVAVNIAGKVSHDSLFDILYKGIKGFLLINIGKKTTSCEMNVFFAHYSYNTIFSNKKTRWYELNLRQRFQKALIHHFEGINIERYEEPLFIKTYYKYKEKII
jgi:hypothetical protein